MRNSIVVFDLDGTVCDSSHRAKHIANKNWDAFYDGIEYDPAHADVVDVLRCMRRFNKTLVCCTARDERYAMQTQTWLRENYLDGAALLMRPAGDNTPSFRLKPQLLIKWLREKFGHSEVRPQEMVQFILEDRDAVVQAWRDLGFSCWQVREGQY